MLRRMTAKADVFFAVLIVCVFFSVSAFTVFATAH
jgi:hypothetical protein